MNSSPPSCATRLALVLVGALSLAGCQQEVGYPPLQSSDSLPSDSLPCDGCELVSKPLHQPEQAFRLAIDDTSAYWTTLGGRSVEKAPKEGGPGTTLFLGPECFSPAGLALDTTSAYFGSTCDGTLARAAKDGSDAAVLRPSDGGEGEYAVAVDDTYVYTAEHDNWRVRRMTKDGSEDVELSTQGKNASSIVLDDTHIYWATESEDGSSQSGSIARVPKAGGETTLVATGLDVPSAVDVDDAYVYWVMRESCVVQRAPKEGGVPVTLAQGREGGHCMELRVDQTDVYWASALDAPGEPAGIWKVPKQGGARTRVLAVDGVYGLALDDTHIYFAAGWVMRIAK